MTVAPLDAVRRPARLATRRFEDVPQGSVNRLRAAVEQAVVDASGGLNDLALRRIVTECVGAFLEAEGDPQLAARHTRGLFAQIGSREAHRGHDSQQLAMTFRAAGVAAQTGLSRAIGSRVTYDVLTKLREDINTYIGYLHAATKAALDRTRTFLSMSDDERRHHVHAAVFEGRTIAGLDELLALAGWDPQELWVPVISVHEPITTELLRHPRAINDGSELEVVVPESLVDYLADSLAGQAVTGPPATMPEAADALSLARQAAELLRDGAVEDDRRIVPCADLLGDLVVQGNRVLTDLIVQKHLAGLEAVEPISQRIDLGVILLHSLERGVPTNQSARDLGIPLQTAHSRMKRGRRLIGDALDDPAQRLELIVALRAALPRWRER